MKLLQLVAACVLLNATAFAQINDGSYWADSEGEVCTVDVTETTETGVTVTVTDATGFTQPLPGEQATGSSADKPKAESFSEGSTGGHPDQNTYRGKDGKVQKKVNGKWTNCRKVKKPKTSLQAPSNSTAGTGPRGASPGEEGTSLPD